MLRGRGSVKTWTYHILVGYDRILRGWGKIRIRGNLLKTKYHHIAHFLAGKMQGTVLITFFPFDLKILFLYNIFTLAKLFVNISKLRNRLLLWDMCLPHVKPFYAVKCNNLKPIVQTLKKYGTGFDCASSDEFNAVRGSEIIYANPCKSRKELKLAKQENILYQTFDSTDELLKILEINPLSKPILRIHVDDKGGSRIPLNKKFGLNINDVEKIKPFSSSIYGLAFHVGSDCTSVDSYKSAFSTVKEFVTKLPDISHEILDIGGGFSGSSLRDPFFLGDIAPLINNQIHKSPFKRIIAEPGRFFAEESCTLHVEVIGRKTLPCGTEAITLDDSVYGIFSGVLFDGFKPQFKCITRSNHSTKKQFTIFGRTCDSADRIAENIELPSDCNEGDIIEIPSIGAYSYVSASEFNGFPRPEIIEIQS